MNRRAEIVLNTPADRQTATHWIEHAPPGSRIVFKGPQRTLEQNSRLWAMLTDVARQKRINGRRYSTDQWKVMFLKACGQEAQFVPSLDGTGFIPYGQSSSDLTVAEMSDLIEFMFAWGAENNVVWSDPQESAA
ncbi:recombination protein NinB [Bradyrhizobium sp. HKCCYLRH2015]|uniref:recombination protein NinB n=1 Tax=Bradyrhizobium sp. HKCCYLRH2015 TaxID=3420742 RepID=UPI003EBD9B35